MPSIADISLLRKNTNNAFRFELVGVAERLGIDVDWLATVIRMESGFRPDARPRRAGKLLSSAIGLMQWLDARAKLDGTTTAKLARMSAIEQLRYLEIDYARARSLSSLGDAYLWVFAPAFVGASSSTVVYAAPSIEYHANSGLDRDKDGTITVAEATSRVQGIYAAAMTRPRVKVTPPRWIARRLGAAAVAAAVVAATLRWRKR